MEPHESEQLAFGRVIATALVDVVEELRVIDLVDLIGFIRFGSYAAIEDLMQSATELFFREGTMSFGWTASADVDWHEVPGVTFGMEFRHGPVSAFFDLSLRAATAAVEITGLRFFPDGHSTADRLRLLSAALAEARLPKRIPPPRHPRATSPAR